MIILLGCRCRCPRHPSQHAALRPSVRAEHALAGSAALETLNRLSLFLQVVNSGGKAGPPNGPEDPVGANFLPTARQAELPSEREEGKFFCFAQIFEIRGRPEMVTSSLRSAALRLRRGIRSLIANCLRFSGCSALIDQLVFSRLQSDLSRIVAKEIDRLDGYLVYHVNSLSRQIGELNRMSYVHANLDALLMTGEFDLLIPTAEAGLISYVTRHGVEAIEPAVHAVLQARLHAGDTAVDIGASIGVHALTMAKIVGPSGRVVCVEPLAHIASTMERTLRLNGFSGRTQVICSAASDSAGEATLHRALHRPRSSLFPIAEESTSLTVRTIALDDHFAPGERVDMVKVDISGAEPLAYKGMSRILRENPEIELILKWSASDFARSNQSAEPFWDLIRSDGFKPLRIDDEQPGRLMALQEMATVPDNANILFTRG